MLSKEIIEHPMNCKPHVVLLGAGATKAAFPEGDALGNQLPLMNDLIDKIELSSLLEKSGVNISDNFETIYSQLTDNDLKNKIENEIFNYFSELVLPETVTVYDQLLLSLREKDAIFTFNWDPFLFDAYQRNSNIMPLPHIYFLHGNVRIGACKNCDNWGRKDTFCSLCNIKFTDVPLLYPISKKNYFEDNRYTAVSWKHAMCWFSDAFTISIFGYSAPTSDNEAVDLLKKAWLDHSDRQFEHIEIIDILCESQLYSTWRGFTPTSHLLSQKTFKNSRLCSWPRRSCESLYYSMSKGFPCEEFSLPITDNLSELHRYIKKIAQYETK